MKRLMRVVIVVASGLVLSSVVAEPTLTSVTTHPKDNFHSLGEIAQTVVMAKGLTPNERRAVDLIIFDFTRTNAVKILNGEFVADGAGVAEVRFQLPTDRYGIFYAKVDSGDLSLPKVGTAPKGFFTYGVLEDPAKMPDLDPWDAFMGEHCVSTPWLWQRGGFGTLCGPFAPSTNRLIVATLHRVCGEEKIGTKRFWTIATNADVQAEYRDNLRKYVVAAVAQGAGRQGRRVYETLWEPNLRAPSAEAIVAAQKIAWETIHDLDPEALVGAYTSSGIDLRFMRVLMELGLGKYMNALTVHPYKGLPEVGGYIDDVRGMKRIIREYVGRDIPMFATESGMNEANTIDGDKRKLCGQLRQALVLFGEGFQMYFPFYGTDFGADLNNQGDGDYGLCYNSQYPKVRFGSKITQPRPIFGGLAAMARLTEGRRPSCSIQWLAETVLGYAFTDKSDTDVVIALWDWGARGTKVKIPVGRDEIDVADVMGNVSRMKTPDGTLELVLSEYPQYVLRADPTVWGFAAQKKLKWSERRFKSANELAPVGVATFTPTFANGEPGVAVVLENRTDCEQSVMLETRIPGEPDCRKKTPVVVPAHKEKRVDVLFAGFRPEPTHRFETIVRVVPQKGSVAEAKEMFNFLSVPGNFSFGACRVKLDCDSRFLVFDVTVDDATPKNDRSGWWSWNGDSVQVALAKEALRERTQNDVADACNQALCEYTVAKTPFGNEVCRTVSWDLSRFPFDHSRGGLVDAETAPREVTHDGTAWHYRLSLPWEFLNLNAPTKGTTFRMAMQYNDRVPEDRGVRQTECFKMKVGAPKNFGWVVVNK